jgi:hypothetical protein
MTLSIRPATEAAHALFARFILMPIRAAIALLAASLCAPVFAQIALPPPIVVSTVPGKPAKSDESPSKPYVQSYDVRQFTCPIGGKVFEQEVGYSAFPLITLPDGSWLGDTEIGVQIPVCPDNGLVLIPDLSKSAQEGSDRIAYADYTTAELARLPALIADPAYIALKEDGRYAQAWWLATQLGRPAEDRFFMLQRSTWATRDPAKRKRLVKRLAEEGPAIIAAFNGKEAVKSYHGIYIVNALREIGRFDEALALLDQLEAKGEPIPGQPDPDNIYGPGDADGPMRLAIAQKDDGRFAAELLPAKMVNDICDNELAAIYGPTSAATLASCKIRRDRERKESEDFEKALTLRDDKPALDRQCAATPNEKRDAALQRACEMRQDDRDQIAGNILTQDGAKLAADCEAGRADERTGALRYACISYNSALGIALGDQIADDDVAYAIICPGNIEDEAPDRADFAGSACSSAKSKRKYKEEERLLKDPAALDIRCANSDTEAEGDIDFYEVLLSACSSLASNREAAEIERLATEPAAFEARCARYAKTNSAGNDVNLDWKSDAEKCNRAWRLRENTRAKTEAEAKGLKCFHNVIYSPERPECVTPAEYDRQMKPAPQTEPDPYDMGWLDEDSSLMKEAHIRAAAAIVQAKAEKRYPKRRPGDLR